MPRIGALMGDLHDDYFVSVLWLAKPVLAYNRLALLMGFSWALMALLSPLKCP